MKHKLVVSYQWVKICPTGTLGNPKDSWGENHQLGKISYASKELAIEEYQRYVDNNLSCPDDLLLIERYSKVIDWELCQL